MIGKLNIEETSGKDKVVNFNNFKKSRKKLTRRTIAGEVKDSQAKCTGEEHISFTPTEAKKFLELNNYPAQRTLYESHINEIAKAILDGKLVNARIVVAYVKEVDDIWLADGQHTCHAVQKVKSPIKGDIYYYDCETKDDFAKLYTYCDMMHKPRTPQQIVKTKLYAMGLEHWPLRLAALIASGCDLYKNRRLSARSKLNKWQRADLIEKYQHEAEFVINLLSGDSGSNRHLKRQSTVAVMIESFRKHPEEAREFWIMVRDGEGITKTNPAYVLREYLKGGKIYSHGSKHDSEQKMYHPIAVFNQSIAAFNAFLEGKIVKTKTFRIPKDKFLRIK